MTNDVFDRLAALLDSRLEVTRSLQALGSQQKAALVAEDVSMLETTLQQKQELMDRIDQLDAGFDPIWTELSQQGIADWEALSQRVPDSPLLAKRTAIGSLLGQMMEADLEHGHLSQQLLSKLEQDMQVVNRSAAASRTYAQTGVESGVSSVFMNRKI